MPPPALAGGGSGGLIGLLGRGVAAGDVNACCGILRRIYSESLHESAAAGASVVGLGTSLFSEAMKSDSRSWGSRIVADSLTRRPAPQTPSPSGASGGHVTVSLVEEVLRLGRSCLQDDPALVRPSSVQLLCHTAQRAGDWEAALHFADHLSRPPAPMFLSSLLNPGNYPHVTAHCRARQWPLDVPNAIRVLANVHGEWRAALRVARAAERDMPCGEPYSLGVLVPYLAASGAQEEAIALFESGLARGTLVERNLVQHLLIQTASLRQWQTCLHMLGAIAKTQEGGQLLPASAEFFAMLTDVSPSWETSLTIFSLACQLEVRPDRRTLGTLLAQCDRAGAWAAAAQVYDTAVAEGFVADLATDQTYHALLRTLSAARQWEKAMEALSWMGKASEASAATGMGELVVLCERSGQWEAATAVGEGLIAAAGGAEMLSAPVTLSLLLACARSRRWEMALDVFRRQVADVRCEPHPLMTCAVLQACGEAARWAEAMRVLADARAQQPRLVVPPMAHRLAMRCCVAARQWDRALDLLRAAREDGLPQDNHGQRLGMWAAALTGRWELALLFLQRLPAHARTQQDRMLIRSATRGVSPQVGALGLKLLQSR